MKGPGLKLGLEVRRRWRCPETDKRLFSAGNVTALRSPFTKEERWMVFEESKNYFREVVPVESFVHTEVMEPLPASEIRVPIDAEERALLESEEIAGDAKTVEEVVPEESHSAEDSFGLGLEVEDGENASNLDLESEDLESED